MNLNDIVENIGLKIKTDNNNLDIEVTRGYSSDLLSDVMAHANEGDLWITMQAHQNIVAVAALKTLSVIILVNNRQPEAATLKKANEENIPIMTTELSTFELIGRLYELGIKG